MKKFFLLMTGFILLVFTACRNDELVNGGGMEVPVSFDVQIPDNGAATRTNVEDNTGGDGSQINRCILEIYLGDKLYGERHVAMVSLKSAKFSDIPLVTSQTYRFVFWADHVADSENGLGTDLHYKTDNDDGLKNITFMGAYEGNDETRDAFYCSTEKMVTGAFTLKADLTRPFGQLNIKTDDLGNINKDNLKPDKVLLTFRTKVYTAFNAFSEEASGLETLTNETSVDVINADGALTRDYILAPLSGQLPVDMKLEMYNGTQSITFKELNNIPIQRNYKTNVSGSLLTANGTMEVNVVSQFTDETAVPVKEVESTSEVFEALKESDNVVVKQAPMTEATIQLPKYESADKELSITLPETSQKITIKYDENASSSNAPKVLNVTIPNATELVIEATETTVYLNGEEYNNVTAGTAPNTLVIGDGVTVNKLTVNAGNVKVVGSGVIKEIGKPDSYTNTVYIIASDSARQLPFAVPEGFKIISSEETLAIKEALEKGESYTLQEDADITNASIVVPATVTTAILDLNGHVITADNSTQSGDKPGKGCITVYGKLTLQDAKGSGRIVANQDYLKKVYSSGLINVIGEDALLTMTGGTIYAVRNEGQYGVCVYGGGDFTMTGGRIEAGYFAVSGSGNDETNDSKITISGGELISTEDYALYLSPGNTTTISGGRINGAAGGVCIRRGKLTISDNAEILSVGGGDTGDWSDGTGGLGNSALCIAKGYGNCEVNIKGGTFIAVKDAVLIKENSDEQQYTCTVSVSGGTFSDPSMFGYLAEKADVKVKLTKDYEGPGLGIFNSGTKNGKEATVEVDLNYHKWTLTDKPLFGSTGTVNQFFHLEKGAKVTFRNGTIQPQTDSSGKMLIQNYCDLTLDNVSVIGGSTCEYVISNNNGSCNITGSTITAATGKCAFDVYAYKPYPDGVTVTVNSGSVINGRVEIDGNSDKKNNKLIINGGTFNGDLKVASGYGRDNIDIKGGKFGSYSGWSDYL